MPDQKLDYQPLTLWNIPDRNHFFRDEGNSFYAHMFIEDISTHIMPYSSHSSSNRRSFQVNISDPLLEMNAKVLFHTSLEFDPLHQRLSEVIFEFIRESASLIIARGGKAVFEIVDGIVSENGNAKAVYVLKPISGKVLRFGMSYYQMIPKEIQEGKRRFISIPQSKAWELKVPKELGRAKDIIALSNNLLELGKTSFIDSAILTNQKDFWGFDIKEFHSSIDATILHSTRRWGWDMRMSISNQHALEYYMFYRMLRFGYSMSILRTDILSQMNRLLRRLGYDVTLSFSGIPTPEEYFDAMKQMEQRQLSFSEASALIHFSL